ncbi:hypothetical protein RCH12_002763 [Cryobacterium sp. MP_3.1]|uniref:BglII/BstYI family type II restriction endonuclease n=1 Tax=Cryobacterium sp. MP_3.1 TaxID=3071711 RepID=UPI002E02FE34|nr:hypothetical protein [Cryobacterium sp. MP_3.1]
MLLTDSYLYTIPRDVLARYEFAEVRNAASIIAHTNPGEFAEVIDVLRDFAVEARDLLLPGGSEGTVPKKLNGAFRHLGWREARVDTILKTTLVVFPYAPAGERHKELIETEAEFEGYKADWVKGRVAGDTEWNAKDGNLDRDVASYRSLYETGFIDGAILITRTQEDLRLLEQDLIDELLEANPADAAASLGASEGVIGTVVTRLHRDGVQLRLGTSTTTNLPKLVHRLQRGDGGGCPILAVAISTDTWDGSRVAQD